MTPEFLALVACAVENHGVTAVARAIGVHHSALSRILEGKAPTYATSKKVFEHFYALHLLGKGSFAHEAGT